MNTDIDVNVEVFVNIDKHFGCLKGVSKSVQVLLNNIQAVTVLTVIIREWRALFMFLTSCDGP